MEHDSITERESFLYAPERLENRFRHFETLCLPALKRQTDPDFIFVVLIGHSLPARARQRLDTLLSDMPQARIVSRPPLPHRPVCKEVINEARGPRDATCLQFRMDDDDAVAVDFVARFREAAAAAAPLLRQNGTMAIDFCNGFEAMAGAEGLRARPVLHPYLTAGLGFVAGPSSALTVMNFNHSKILRFMPTVTLSDTPMFVRSLSDFNDSHYGKRHKPQLPDLIDQDTRALLHERFAIDEERVREVFA